MTRRALFIASVFMFLGLAVMVEFYGIRAFATYVIMIDKAFRAPLALSKSMLHQSTHRMVMVTPYETTGCSATAIGRHALLTAAHCKAANTTIYLDKGFVKIHVTETMYDDADHAILLISDATFEEYVNVRQGHNFEQGERVFMWGSPHRYPDIYREGYFAGTTVETWEDEAEREGLMFDMNQGSGDSGSGIFDQAGELVGVLSFAVDATNGKLMGAFPLRFTEAAIERARDFD